MKNKIKSIITLLIIIAITCLTIVGCGAKKSESTANYAKPEMSVSEDKIGLGEDNSAPGTVTQKNDSKTENSLNDNKVDPLKNQGKIIRNGTIKMETLNFDETVKQILSSASSIGAYVQSSNVSGKSIETNLFKENRSGVFIVRIPKSKFDSFILNIGNLGNVTAKQISTEDITSVYFDTQAHLKSLTIQEERLLELLKKTGELKDIIALENELSRVRYEIESLTGSLKKWDNLIDFCTLNIQISEVQEIKENPVSFADKIANGFVSSVKSIFNLSKGFVIFISIFIPYLFILTILIIIARYIYIRRKKS